MLNILVSIYNFIFSFLPFCSVLFFHGYNIANISYRLVEYSTKYLPDLQAFQY